MTIDEVKSLKPGSRVIWYKSVGTSKWKKTPAVFVRASETRMTLIIEDATHPQGIKQISAEFENVMPA